MRGYRRLRETGGLGRIAAVRDEITNTLLPFPAESAATTLLGAAASRGELVTRQYLLARSVTPSRFAADLLYGLGRGRPSVVHGLPAEWRAIVRQHGFPVAERSSALSWCAFVARHVWYGVLAVWRRAAVSALSVARRPAVTRVRHVFFDGLTAANLPQPCRDGRSHDIVTWYAQWDGRVEPLEMIAHTGGAADGTVHAIPMVSVRSPITPLRDARRLGRYLAWAFAATASTIGAVVRGRWWSALLLGEAAAAAIVREQDPQLLSREYFFHNSAWIYRPLWTYEAERQGARVTFYFYSTNCESFKRPDGYAIQANSWQAMSWPHYLVWDLPQEEFVRRAIGETARVSVVGPIWFATSDREAPALPARSVAVFDVQPHRGSLFQVLGAPDDYYAGDTAIQFLRDIHQVVSERGMTMALKRKREIGSALHRRYRAVVEQLSASDSFVPVDSDVSAQRVIEASEVVISMPFTSTALLAREADRPSIFYDPLGAVQPDDRAAHGIPIISGIDELRTWFAAL